MCYLAALGDRCKRPDLVCLDLWRVEYLGLDIAGLTAKVLRDDEGKLSDEYQWDNLEEQSLEFQIFVHKTWKENIYRNKRDS